MGTLKNLRSFRAVSDSASDTPTEHERHDLTTDLAFCEEVLPRVSRTFALSIATLPESLREIVRVSYLLCRIVDTVEDDARVEWRVRSSLFDEFDALMGDDARLPKGFESECVAVALGDVSAADHELATRAGAVFRVFRAQPAELRAAVRPHILEMSRGMREYAARAAREGRLRIVDMADLERYCYFVAGTVGKLLTALFERVVPSMSAHALAETRARAVSFGLALQMVNIVKDVAEDHARGDCFLPLDRAEAHGVSLDELLAPERRDAALAVVGDVCAQARVNLRRAREYTALWPAREGRDVRLFCAVPLALALATLHEVEHGGDALRADVKPKVSREVVWRAFADVQLAVGDDTHLRWMFGYYGSGMFDDAACEAQGAAAPVVAPPPRPSSRGLSPSRLRASD